MNFKIRFTALVIIIPVTYLLGCAEEAQKKSERLEGYSSNPTGGNSADQTTTVNLPNGQDSNNDTNSTLENSELNTNNNLGVDPNSPNQEMGPGTETEKDINQELQIIDEDWTKQVNESSVEALADKLQQKATKIDTLVPDSPLKEKLFDEFLEENFQKLLETDTSIAKIQSVFQDFESLSAVIGAERVADFKKKREMTGSLLSFILKIPKGYHQIVENSAIKRYKRIDGRLTSEILKAKSGVVVPEKELREANRLNTFKKYVYERKKDKDLVTEYTSTSTITDEKQYLEKECILVGPDEENKSCNIWWKNESKTTYSYDDQGRKISENTQSITERRTYEKKDGVYKLIDSKNQTKRADRAYEYHSKNTDALKLSYEKSIYGDIRIHEYRYDSHILPNGKPRLIEHKNTSLRLGFGNYYYINLLATDETKYAGFLVEMDKTSELISETKDPIKLKELMEKHQDLIKKIQELSVDRGDERPHRRVDLRTKVGNERITVMTLQYDETKKDQLNATKTTVVFGGNTVYDVTYQYLENGNKYISTSIQSNPGNPREVVITREHTFLDGIFGLTTDYKMTYQTIDRNDNKLYFNSVSTKKHLLDAEGKFIGWETESKRQLPGEPLEVQQKTNCMIQADFSVKCQNDSYRRNTTAEKIYEYRTISTGMFHFVLPNQSGELYEGNDWNRYYSQQSTFYEFYDSTPIDPDSTEKPTSKGPYGHRYKTYNESFQLLEEGDLIDGKKVPFLQNSY